MKTYLPLAAEKSRRAGRMSTTEYAGGGAERPVAERGHGQEEAERDADAGAQAGRQQAARREQDPQRDPAGQAAEMRDVVDVLDLRVDEKLQRHQKQEIAQKAP